VIRRSFRIGLWLGLLGGIAVAVVKIVQARQPSTEPAFDRSPLPAPPTPAWPRLEERETAAAQPAAARPVAPAARASAPTARPSAPPAPKPVPPVAARATEPESAPSGWADAPVASIGLPPEPAVKKAEPRRVPVKAATKAAAKKAPVKKAAPTWVDPKGNICPKTHPVKAKLASKIFQMPGMFAYDRTNPDRCYKDPDAALKAGFRSAKR
jgi:hypothetical protein